MAIQSSFNLNDALYSQSYAYKCWYNYNYGNNTMGISSNDMGKITQTWGNEVRNWEVTALDDENVYRIDDEDFSIGEKNGRKQAIAKVKEQTGGETPNKAGMIARGVVDGAAGLAGGSTTVALGGIGKGVANSAAGGVVKAVAGQTAGSAAKALTEKAAEEVAKGVVKKGASETATRAASEAAKTAGAKAAEKGVAGFVGKAAEKAAAKAAEKAAGKGAEEAAKAGSKAADKVTNAGKNIGWIVTAPLALATGTAYTIKQPNKTEVKACNAYKDEMNDSQTALYEAQGNMEDATRSVEELSEEAQMTTEEANAIIEDQQAEMTVYKSSYDDLIKKKESGVKLRKDEVELLKSLAPVMQELGDSIEQTRTDSEDINADLQDEIGTYEVNYDNAAMTVAEVQGLTNEAASIDSATQVMCVVETAGQGLNAASGAQAAYQAGAFAASGGMFTAWAWAFVAMGAAGAVQSGVGTVQQGVWAGQVSTEIGMRKDTQDVNTLTNDTYDESIEGYEGTRSVVDGLEVFVPDDLEDNVNTVVEGATRAATENENGGNIPPVLGLGSTVNTGNNPYGSGSSTGAGTRGTTGTGNSGSSGSSGAGNDKPIKDKDEDV